MQSPKHLNVFSTPVATTGKTVKARMVFCHTKNMKYSDYLYRMWPQIRWYRCSSWVTVIRRSCWRCWGWHWPSGVTWHLLWRSLHRCCSLCRSCDWHWSSSWCLLKFSNLQEQVSTMIVYHDQSWYGWTSPRQSWGQRYGVVLGRGQGKISTPFWSDVTWKFKRNIHLNPPCFTDNHLMPTARYYWHFLCAPTPSVRTNRALL